MPYVNINIDDIRNADPGKANIVIDLKEIYDYLDEDMKLNLANKEIPFFKDWEQNNMYANVEDTYKIYQGIALMTEDSMTKSMI